MRCGCVAVAFIFSIYLKPVLYLFACANGRMDLVLNDDVDLNPTTDGRRRIIVPSLFCCALNGFVAVVLISDRSLSNLAIG